MHQSHRRTKASSAGQKDRNGRAEDALREQDPEVASGQPKGEGAFFDGTRITGQEIGGLDQAIEEDHPGYGRQGHRVEINSRAGKDQ